MTRLPRPRKVIGLAGAGQLVRRQGSGNFVGARIETCTKITSLRLDAAV